MEKANRLSRWMGVSAASSDLWVIESPHFRTCGSASSGSVGVVKTNPDIFYRDELKSFVKVFVGKSHLSSKESATGPSTPQPPQELVSETFPRCI
jgi:hypothetical protein